MIAQRNAAKDGKRKPAKRMLVAGKKIGGVWQVRTFLRALADTHEPFWETRSKRQAQ